MGDGTDAATFGMMLKELREKLGMSQRELASKVQLTTRQLSRLETGKSAPSWPTVMALADFFGVSSEVFRLPISDTPPHRRGRPRKQPL